MKIYILGDEDEEESDSEADEESDMSDGEILPEKHFF